jgi:transcription initiation factor TFIIB
MNDSTRGDMICVTCGLVIGEKVVDPRPEWRAFTQEEEQGRARTGKPISISVFDKGLSTMIDWRDRDAHGNKLKPEMRAMVYRLRKWNARSRLRSSTDRNLRHAMAELDRIASQLSIARGVKEAGAIFYRKVLEKKLTRGRSIDLMACACLYAACRSRKIPRTIDEFASITRGGKVEIGRFYRLLIRALGIKIPLPSPVDYVCRFGTELGIPSTIQRRAIELVKRAEGMGLTSGKDPTGLAAAVLYITCQVAGEQRTQKVIASVSRVTEVTLRNRYKEIARALNISIPTYISR